MYIYVCVCAVVAINDIGKCGQVQNDIRICLIKSCYDTVQYNTALHDYGKLGKQVNASALANKNTTAETSMSWKVSLW